jgi:ATP-dependent RNA helicase DDX19/DBP5
LLKGIYAMKFKKPSRIQERALPIAIKQKVIVPCSSNETQSYHRRQHLQKNLIAQSQNGTGKTGAFALTMLSMIDKSKAYPQALLICPSREIARKNAQVIDQLAQFTGISSCLLVVPEMEQSASCLRCVQCWRDRSSRD